MKFKRPFGIGFKFQIVVILVYSSIWEMKCIKSQVAHYAKCASWGNYIACLAHNTVLMLEFIQPIISRLSGH